MKITVKQFIKELTVGKGQCNLTLAHTPEDLPCVFFKTKQNDGTLHVQYSTFPNALIPINNDSVKSIEKDGNVYVLTMYKRNIKLMLTK